MAIGIALDKDNNVVLENGTFKLVSDGAELLQRIRCRLLAYKKEYFLNRNDGVPYFEEIFKKPIDLSTTESILRKVVQSTEDVTEVTELRVTYGGNTSRSVSVYFSFNSIYGSYTGVTLNV